MGWGRVGGGHISAALWARGGLDPGEVVSFSQGQTQRQTTIRTRTSKGQVKLASSPIPQIPVFGLSAGTSCRTFSTSAWSRRGSSLAGTLTCKLRLMVWVVPGWFIFPFFPCFVGWHWLWQLAPSSPSLYLGLAWLSPSFCFLFVSAVKINHITCPAANCGGGPFVFGLRQQAMISLLGVSRPQHWPCCKPLLPRHLTSIRTPAGAQDLKRKHLQWFSDSKPTTVSYKCWYILTCDSPVRFVDSKTCKGINWI